MDKLSGCIAAMALIVFALAIAFGADCFASQLVLFVLGSFHIIAGFWQAFLLVITTEIVVGLGAGAGSKASK